MRARLAIAAGLLAALEAPGEPLGTLFLSAEERARLDAPRATPPVAPAQPMAPPTITGHVWRSDGRHTVFVDGAPRRVDAAAQDTLPAPVKRKPL